MIEQLYSLSVFDPFCGHPRNEDFAGNDFLLLFSLCLNILSVSDSHTPRQLWPTAVAVPFIQVVPGWARVLLLCGAGQVGKACDCISWREMAVPLLWFALHSICSRRNWTGGRSTTAPFISPAQNS